MSIIGLFLLVLLVPLVVVALYVIVRARPKVQVNDETVVRLPAAEVERRLFGPLGSIEAAQMTSVFPGQLTLSSSYVPGWTIFVAVIFFPVGLIAPIFVRPKLALTMRFLDEGGSTRIQVAGSTRPRVAFAVADAVEGLKTTALA